MGAAAVAIVAAELTLAGSGRPMNTGSLDKEPGFGENQFDGSTEVLDGIRRLTGATHPPSRIDTVDDSMNWAVAARFIGVPSANGNDPLALFRAMQVRRIFTGGERWGRYYQVANPDSNVLSLLNVRFLLSRKPVQSEQFTKAAELPWRAVYENRGALPRFFLVSRIHQAANLEQAVAFLRSKEFDPRAVAVVEGAVPFSEPARERTRGNRPSCGIPFAPPGVGCGVASAGLSGDVGGPLSRLAGISGWRGEAHCDDQRRFPRPARSGRTASRGDALRAGDSGALGGW